AAPITLFTNLTGSQEVPSTGSPGIGNAFVVFDSVAHTLFVNIVFAGLLSPTTASHIHCCVPAGVNANVATQVPTFSGFPLGVTSGSYMNTFNTSLASTYNPAFVTASGGTVPGAEAALFAGFIAGQTYLNIHTNQFMGGEIRGQLAVIPETSTLALVGV